MDNNFVLLININSRRKMHNRQIKSNGLGYLNVRGSNCKTLPSLPLLGIFAGHNLLTSVPEITSTTHKVHFRLTCVPERIKNNISFNYGKQLSKMVIIYRFGLEG